MQVKEKYLELDLEQLEYNKAIYYCLAYLTSMQGISCQMPGLMTHKLESRFPGEISITSVMQMTPPLWQKVKRN